MEYIVIHCPSPYIGNPVSIVHYVVSKTQLNKAIEDYFNNKYEHTEEYAPIQVFKRLVIGKRGRTFRDAARHCRFLNSQLNSYNNENSKTQSRVVETRRPTRTYSSLR